MFDVDWSDPNRESVGDRRARKKREKGKGRDDEDGLSEDGLSEEHEQGQKTDENEGGSSRASESLRSSVSSVEKQFGFFGAKQRKKTNSTRKGKSRSVASSSLRAPTIDEQPQNEQPPAHAPSSSSTGPLDLPSTLSSSFSGAVFDRLEDIERGPGGSLFGCDITNPQPGFSTLFQELGDGVSMVTKTIETTLRPRTAEDSKFLVSTASISAANDDPQLANASSSKTVLKSTLKADPSNDPPQFVEVVRPVPGTADSPTTKKQVSNESASLPVIIEDSRTERIENTRQQHKHCLRPKLSAPPISPASQKPTDNPDTWKAPDDWDISPGEENAPVAVGDSGILDGTIEFSGLTLDITHMQRELDQMIRASPQIILQRLKDTWGCYDPEGEPRDKLGENPELDDGLKVECDEAERALDAALAYKEREMENKRWLLTVLYNMEAILESGATLPQPVVEPKTFKALALFEPQATASYVASINHSIPVYHLSSDPLSHKRYPNIHPVVCPTISSSVLELSPDSFSSISCLSITSILPSAEIPKLLKSVHRTLVPGGCLQLMIIDPWPVADCMGPKLQEWLDENLIFNLELQFRCTHPSRMFPVWLSDARLRANGSIIASTRFQAIPQDRDTDSDMSARSKDSTEGELDIQKELRSIAGRLLWQEIWGSFVTGLQWWWEDPEIVEECIQMETYWEYCIIAACKQEAGDED